MNQSKRRAFSALAGLHPDRHPMLLVYRSPPGEKALRSSRVAAGWRVVSSADFLEPPQEIVFTITIGPLVEVAPSPPPPGRRMEDPMAVAVRPQDFRPIR